MRLLSLSAVLILLLADRAATTEALARTDPSSWSKDGYLQFRWGMGPGDVGAALQAKDAALRSDDRFQRGADDYSPADESYIVIVFGFEIAGIDMRRARFGFLDGRLFEVELNPTVPGAPWTRWQEWHAQFSELLTKKYGKPFSDHAGLGRVWLKSWMPSASLGVMLAASERNSELVYYEPRVNQRARAKREAAERAAAKPALDKL